MNDLRSDKGMEWVPGGMWLTHLELEARAGELDYDLAASTRSGDRPSLEAAGVSRGAGEPVGSRQSRSPWVVAVACALGFAGLVAVSRSMARPVAP